MLLNRSTMDSLYTGFKALLIAGFAMATLPIDKFVTVVTSTTAIEKYPMLNLLSTMKKWVGPRQVENFDAKVMHVVNDDYEHTVGVKRNDIEDENLGLANSMFQKMGADAKNLWGKLAILALLANGKWLDNKSFFVTNRKFGDSTINNKGTAVLSADSFNDAYTKMMSYCGHNGEGLDILPDLLICGPSNRGVAFSILKDQKKVTAGGTSDVATDNPNYGLCEFIVHPRLIGEHANKWFLMQANGVIKPVIVQKRKEGELTRMDKETDECVFNENKNKYGLHYRGAAALTLPPLCYYSDGSA